MKKFICVHIIWTNETRLTKFYCLRNLKFLLADSLIYPKIIVQQFFAFDTFFFGYTMFPCHNYAKPTPFDWEWEVWKYVTCYNKKVSKLASKLEFMRTVNTKILTVISCWQLTVVVVIDSMVSRTLSWGKKQVEANWKTGKQWFTQLSRTKLKYLH